MTGVQNTGFSPDWEEIALDAAKARRRALRAVRDKPNLRRLVKAGLSADDARVRKVARILRSRGIPVETFRLANLPMARNDMRTELVFGELACGILRFFRPYEYEPGGAGWLEAFKRSENKRTYTSYYERHVIGSAVSLTGYMVGLLAQCAGYATRSTGRISVSVKYLKDSWKEFEKVAFGKRDELLMSKVVASALRAARDVLERLNKWGPSISRWPRAAALLQAAACVRDALEEADERPITKGDMRKALDLLLWFRGLEDQARGDLEELGLLELIGERPSWPGESTAWKLLAADLPSARGVPLDVWRRWVRRAVQRAARRQLAGTRPAA